MTAIAPAPSPVLTGRWEIDPAHSSVEFRVRHAGLARVRGVFHDFEGALEIGPGDTVRAQGSVATASLDTRLAARDEHLRSADFFDVQHHPRMELVATDVRLLPYGTLTVLAELTIRGVTRTVELHGAVIGTGRDDDGAERVGIELDGHLDRREFGLTWNAAVDGGGVLVANRVDLHLEVSAVRAHRAA